MMQLTKEDMDAITAKVRMELPIPEKTCPSKLNKLFGLREMKKREYIDQKKKEYAGRSVA